MASLFVQLPLVVSTLSGVVPVSVAALASTYEQSLTLDGTTAQTFTPPTGARWLKIHAGPSNTINLMVAFGGTTATSTVGEEFEAGRSEDFNGVSSVSIICKSAITAHKVSLIWSV